MHRTSLCAVDIDNVRQLARLAMDANRRIKGNLGLVPNPEPGVIRICCCIKNALFLVDPVEELALAIGE